MVIPEELQINSEENTSFPEPKQEIEEVNVQPPKRRRGGPKKTGRRVLGEMRMRGRRGEGDGGEEEEEERIKKSGPALIYTSHLK